MALMTHLSTAECWEMLQNETLGRLALIGDDDVPDVFPVNYLAHQGAIYVRTAHDSKLLHVATHPVAGFEVDGQREEEEVWSVVVRGSIARLTDEAEIERAGAGRIASWSPRYKPYVLKLTAHTVTGRRFAKAPQSDRPPRPPRPELPDWAVAAATEPDDASGHPYKIPSVPPVHPGRL